MTDAICTLIYTLSDPVTGRVRYVGKTVRTLEHRLSQHLGCKKTTKVANWVRSLIASGNRPVITEIERVVEGWELRERHWIEQFRQQGACLLNLAEGGRGPSGFRHTEDAKRKIAAANLGRKHSPEAIAKMRNRKPTAEHNLNISRAKKGICTTSDEQRARMSAAYKGRKLPPEVIAKLRGPVTEEHKRKLSQAATRVWAERRMLRISKAQI